MLIGFPTHVFSLLIAREILNACVNESGQFPRSWIPTKYESLARTPQEYISIILKILTSPALIPWALWQTEALDWIAVLHSDLSGDVYSVQYVKTVPHSIQSIQGHPIVFSFFYHSLLAPSVDCDPHRLGYSWGSQKWVINPFYCNRVMQICSYTIRSRSNSALSTILT